MSVRWSWLEMSICWSRLKMKGLVMGSYDCRRGEMKENTVVFHCIVTHYYYSAHPPSREGSKTHDGLETCPYSRAIQGLEFEEPHDHHDPTLRGWK